MKNRKFNFNKVKKIAKTFILTYLSIASFVFIILLSSIFSGADEQYTNTVRAMLVSPLLFIAALIISLIISNMEEGSDE